MYEVTIRGGNLSEFYTNAVNLVVLLSRGGVALTDPKGATVIPAEPQTEQAPAQPVVDVGANPPVAEAPRKAGRPKKPGPVIDATAVDGTPKPAEDGGVPDFLQRTESGDAAKAEAPTKEITLDGDIRPRIRDINKAHGDRLATTGKKESDVAIECVNYIKDLFAKFSIAKAADLPVTRYAEFMAKSQAYLEGAAQ